MKFKKLVMTAKPTKGFEQLPLIVQKRYFCTDSQANFFIKDFIDRVTNGALISEHRYAFQYDTFDLDASCHDDARIIEHQEKATKRMRFLNKCAAVFLVSLAAILIALN